VARTRGVHGSDNDILGTHTLPTLARCCHSFLLTIRTRACALAKLAESQEFADRAAKAVPIEQELGLARWLPTAGRQVLASAVVDGQHEPSSPLPSTGALKLKLLAGSGPRTPYPWVLNFSPLYFIFLFSS
jgi:hypothetical protein